MLGNELETMDDNELKKELEETAIFAKLSPMQKSRIVTLLQEEGHTVGFMGDGINDAAALKTADVGISVDTAVDIAKESADIILLEKDLNILRTGVVYGRNTFGNIVKYIKMTTSSNFGNMLSMLGASILLPFLPMLPIQILSQNMLYDISQTAIRGRVWPLPAPARRWCSFTARWFSRGRALSRASSANCWPVWRVMASQM
jgi:Mg2+-importing ATPase